MATNDYILHKKNSADDWEERTVTAEDGKVLGFDASLNPIMVTPATSNPMPLYHYWLEDCFTIPGERFNLGGLSYLNGQVVNPPYSMPNIDLFHFGVMLKSGSSNTGGYSYRATANCNGLRLGTTSKKFSCLLLYIDSFTGRDVAFGYCNTNSLNPSKGVYFRAQDGVLTAHVRGTANTALVMDTVHTLGVNYLYDIEINSDASIAVFRIINPVTGATIESKTVTENIPAQSVELGISIMATCATSQSNICVLKYCGFGTIEGYNRARG